MREMKKNHVPTNIITNIREDLINGRDVKDCHICTLSGAQMRVQVFTEAIKIYCPY